MLRSLYSGVSGMKNLQTKMDVVSNNIANVNTVGFKSSRVLFQDMMSQTMSNATAPGNRLRRDQRNADRFRGSDGSIDTINTVGAPQSTGMVAAMDFYISGPGLLYGTRTRSKWRNLLHHEMAHSCADSNGTLTNSDGMQVLGRSVKTAVNRLSMMTTLMKTTALSGQDAVSPLSIPSTLTSMGKP